MYLLWASCAYWAKARGSRIGQTEAVSKAKGGWGMTLDEMEQQRSNDQDDPTPGGGSCIKVTHVAIVEDEESGEVSRQPITFHLGCSHNPDFHLGAVRG